MLTNYQATSEPNEMGDGALSSVIKTLVFGSRVPEADESPLIPAEIVADAAILVRATPSSPLSANRLLRSKFKQVMRALCERVDKFYVNLSQPSSDMALRFENIRKEILAKVKATWEGSPSRSFHLFQQ